MIEKYSFNSLNKNKKNLLVVFFILISFSIFSKTVYLQWRELNNEYYFNQYNRTYISLDYVAERFNFNISKQSDALLIISSNNRKVFLFPNNYLSVINSMETLRFEKSDIQIKNQEIYFTPEIISKFFNLNLISNNNGYYLNLSTSRLTDVITNINNYYANIELAFTDDVKINIFDLVSTYGYLIKIENAEIPETIFYEEFTNNNLRYIKAYHFSESEIWIRIILNTVSEISYNKINNKVILNLQFPERDMPILVIDPGHGGSDPGATGPSNTHEKTWALEVALLAREKLKDYNIEVYLTRETDIYVDLYDRASFSNDKGAELFISLHMNAFTAVPSVNGTEVYYFDFSETKYARQIAWRENLDYNIDSSIIESWVRDKGNTIKKSEEFATALYNNAGEKGIRTRGVYPAEFAVLAYTRAPAVLWEMEFISNEVIENRFINDNYAKEFAQILVKTIIEYFDLN